MATNEEMGTMHTPELDLPRVLIDAWNDCKGDLHCVACNERDVTPAHFAGDEHLYQWVANVEQDAS
jgi:hypothetical protein